MKLAVEDVGMEGYAGPRKTMAVHSLSGIVKPFLPDDLVHAYREIARSIGSQNGDIILGLDGPGTIPAFALAIALRREIIFATKTNLSKSPKVTFLEPNSPRPNIYVYGLRRGMNVIVVDDGIASGQTMENCIAALTAAGVEIRAIVATVENREGGGRLRRQGYKVFSLVPHDSE